MHSTLIRRLGAGADISRRHVYDAIVQSSGGGDPNSSGDADEGGGESGGKSSPAPSPRDRGSVPHHAASVADSARTVLKMLQSPPCAVIFLCNFGLGFGQYVYVQYNKHCTSILHTSISKSCFRARSVDTHVA